MVEVRREKSAYDALDLKLKELQGYEGRTGYFAENAYPDGTKVAYIAAIQELGSASQNIPPRPTMRPTAKKQESKWRAFAAQMAKTILAGGMTAQDAMESLAFLAAEDVKQAIAKVFSPPLKEGTLKARRARGNMSDKPLIDTKVMVKSVEGRAVKE